MSYLRAVDPFPLESADFNKLHAFYEHLEHGRLTTTRCGDCGRAAWPPRGWCPECGSDRFDWMELPTQGVVHAFTVQETGLPEGFDGPRVFAIVKVGAHRIFAILVEADPAKIALGQAVRLKPLRVADDPRGHPRWLPAFTPTGRV